MADAIGVGLIGFGLAVRVFHAPLIGAVPELRLRAIVSRQRGAIAEAWPDVAILDDAAALFASSQIDLVVVASPTDSHAPLARAALAAGKHVVIDKPFALDLVEARGIVAAAAASDRILSVFHNRRWDSDFLSVRHAVENGTVGEVVHFESRIERFRPLVRDRWRERAGPSGGLWLDIGPHLVDQAIQLFGLPERVTGNLASQREGAETDDWAHVVLDQGGRRSILYSSLLAARPSARFVVHGTGGSLIKRGADIQERQLAEGVRPGDEAYGVDPDPLMLCDGDGERMVAAVRGNQSDYYRRLADAIRGMAPNPVPPHEGLAVMAVIDAARRSASSGASEELALTTEERRPFG